MAPAALPGPPVEVELAGAEVEARRLTVQDLVGLEAALPPGVALGDSVRAVFAVVAVARRAVDEGLVYPQLSGGRDGWAAFWGATVDTSVEAELAAIAAALPPVSAEPFDGDADAVVDDLYPHLGDRIDRLTTEVAGLRKQEAAVEVRLNAKQAELDRAMAQLDVAKTRLVKMRSHLKRALSALRDRLVAIYETGTPDVAPTATTT